MFGLTNPYTWIAGAVAALCIAAGGFYAGYHWESVTVAKLELAQAQAAQKAQATALTETKQITVNNNAAGAHDAQAQQQIVTRTVTITREVPKYVHDQIGCPSGATYGFVRVLVAAERGVDPASLDLPAGVTDDTCSPDEQSNLAAQIVADFGAANANAQQLNDLIAAVKVNDAVATGPAGGE